MRTTKQTRIELDKNDDLVIVMHAEAKVQVHSAAGVVWLSQQSSAGTDDPTRHYLTAEVISGTAQLRRWTPSGYVEFQEVNAQEGQCVRLVLTRVRQSAESASDEDGRTAGRLK